MNRRRLPAGLLFLGLALTMAGCFQEAAEPAAPMPQAPSRFDLLTSLTGNDVILRRLLSPLGYQSIQPKLGTVPAQSLDLAQETFTTVIPPGPPPAAGYGLLVFVPPWDEAEIPDGWASIVDHHHMILVMAGNSGNDNNLYGRRVPLAMAGYENIRHRYPIDPERVYIGGMSGGSRVAQHIALGYSDIFRGAMLDAGSDPIGVDDRLPAPPLALLEQFQEHSRLVYLVGDRDTENLRTNSASADSMRHWCVAEIEERTTPRLGHEVSPAPEFSWALDALERPPALRDEAALSACRQTLAAELQKAVAKASTAITQGDRAEALTRILAIDGEFGGLGAPALKALEEAYDRASRPH